jgi:nucleoside 2-deoxyribosyltransferase
MKIYLAGPEVFLPNAVARGEELKILCATHGLIGLFPLDNELTSVEHGSHAMASAIRTANMELIKSCDGILANMTPFRGPSMDVGTAYEMGVGAALGKVVVGYLKGEKVGYAEKVKKVHKVERHVDGHLRDEEGMSVEEFRELEGGEGLVDNLMISCGVERLCRSEEEGIKALAEILASRKEEKK